MESYGNDIRTSDELEEFGKLLVEWVRDKAINEYDKVLGGVIKTTQAKHWNKAKSTTDCDTLASTIIADVVDGTIFFLLQAIDQEVLNLSLKSYKSSKDINLPSDGLGELSGWYLGDDGWRAQYSRERYNDYDSSTEPVPEK